MGDTMGTGSGFTLDTDTLARLAAFAEKLPPESKGDDAWTDPVVEATVPADEDPDDAGPATTAPGSAPDGSELEDEPDESAVLDFTDDDLAVLDVFDLTEEAQIVALFDWAQFNADLIAGDELALKALDTDPDPSPNPGAAKLRAYWTHGAGAAKINWGVKGDFLRCVAQLDRYVKDAKGLCNVYHRAATGVAPGQEKTDDDALESKSAMLADGSWDFDAVEMGLLPPSTGIGLNDSTGDAEEYKEVGAQVIDVDKRRGVVTAIVSVTGKEDRVSDVIHPGAYADTLRDRTPKGVWSHSWENPVSKTLEVEELHPGDSRLPTEMRGAVGKPVPWPKDAGGLLVKTQFNLLGDRGKQAFADVVFFGDQQEWSIGYKVPPGGAQVKGATRHIYKLDLYEYSPVLFGAMPAAATMTVKSAQAAFKSYLSAEELTEFKELRGDVETADLGDVEAKGWDEALHPRGPGGQFGAGSGYKGKGKDDATVASEQDNVKTLQAALIKMGLLGKDSGKNGGVDGLYGPKTTAAISAFQKKNGLPVTGKADAKTLGALASADGYKAGAGKGAAPKAPAAGKAPAKGARAAAPAKGKAPAAAPAKGAPAKAATPAAGAGKKVPLAARPTDGAAPDVNYDDGKGKGWDYKPGPQSMDKSGGLQEDAVPMKSPSGSSPVKFDPQRTVYDDGAVFTPQGWSEEVAPPAAVKKASDDRNAKRTANGMNPLPVPSYASTGKSPLVKSAMGALMETKDAADNPALLASACDAALDAAMDLVPAAGGAGMPPWVGQVLALLTTADATVDALLDAIGVDDPDEDDASGDDPADADDEAAKSAGPNTLAQVTDSCLDTALLLITAADTSGLPAWFRTVASLMSAADASIDAYLDVLGIPDGDEDDDDSPSMFGGWSKAAFPGAAAPFGKGKGKGDDGKGKPAAATNEDGSKPDPEKPHKFAPDSSGKCKVCGLAFGGHMKAQRASATGEKSDADELLDAVLADMPDDLDGKGIRDYMRNAVGEFSGSGGGDRPKTRRAALDAASGHEHQATMSQLHADEAHNRGDAPAAREYRSAAAAHLKAATKLRKHAQTLPDARADYQRQYDASDMKDDALDVEAKGWAACPNCGSTHRDEYADGTARCEDCGTVLTESKAGRVLSGINGQELLTVWTSLGTLLRRAGVLTDDGKGSESKSEEPVDYATDPEFAGDVEVEVPATETIVVHDDPTPGAPDVVEGKALLGADELAEWRRLMATAL